MRVILFMGVLMLLLCSCAQRSYGPSFMEMTDQVRQQERFWQERLMRTVETPVSNLILAWGEPEKLEARKYRWRKDDIYESGHHEPVAPISQTIRNQKGYAIGYIETPQEDRWVSSIHHHWCEALVTTDPGGVIIHVASDSSGIACQSMFPFP